MEYLLIIPGRLDNLNDYIVKYSSQSVGEVFISPSTDRYQYHLENISQHGDIVKINTDLFHSCIKQ